MKRGKLTKFTPFLHAFMNRKDKEVLQYWEKYQLIRRVHSYFL